MPAALERPGVSVRLPSGHTEVVTPEVAQRLADELVEAVEAATRPRPLDGAAAVREVTGTK